MPVLGISESDLSEVNEMFAFIPLAWLQAADADPACYTRGGAIALSRPLAASDAKLKTTLVYALRATGGHYRLQTVQEGEGGGNENITIVEAF